MQASAILLFAVCLQVSAASYSQTVSFTGRDVSLKAVFASVKKQTGYGVFYQNGEAATLEGTGAVTLDLKNVALDLFLQVALRSQPLEYSVEGTTIFIKKKEAKSLTVDLASGAPVGEIHGRVTNDKGEPLVNANITVKRTGRGTITDANGNFTLHNVNTDDVIAVTFIGYKAQSIPVRDRTSFTLVMDPASNELDKMVVQAYGQTSQRLATGNIGVVRAEDIAKRPVMDVMQTIQGKVPGAVITNTSGYASGTAKAEIRGRNTIDQSFPSDPLYIIDGVPLTILDLKGNSSYDNGSQGMIQTGLPSPAQSQSPFFSINPNDVESIEILKDADATAIYGSRGSNGVILITTKKGKAGKTHLNTTLYSGISQTPRYYHLLNRQQYISMREEALTNDGIPIDIYNAPDLVAWDTTRSTDWQRYFWGGLGKSTDAEVSASGGDVNTTFRIAAGYHYLTEILTHSGANKRGSLSFNINHKTQDQKFNLSLTGNYSRATSDMIYIPGSITLPPNAPPIYDEKGNLNYSGWAPLNGNFPFGSLLQPYTTKTNLLNSNMVLSYQPLKGFLIKTSLGYNNAQTEQTYLTPIASLDPSFNLTGTSSFGFSFFNNVIIEPQLEYNTFIGKARFSVLTGASTQMNTTSSATLTGQGYTNDALLTSVNNAPTRSGNNNYGNYKYAAIFGRLNYNWLNKYILNLNLRRDGSSKFGPNRQYGTFASVGGAWIFSEETFSKSHLSFLSFGKLRFSYGTTGGDQIRQYAYLSQWSFNRNAYNNILPVFPTSHTDSTLHWQVNRKLEAALNLAVLKDHLIVEISWYRDRCNDQLINFPTPSYTGFSSVITNSPANVQNQGWEFNFEGKPIDKSQFKWSFSFNIALNRNKLLSYPNLLQSPYSDQYIIGKPLNIKKKLKYTGVDPQSGLYTFSDKNHDGNITIDYTNHTTDDRYVIDLSPKFDGGFTNDFHFKNWDLSLFIYFRKQQGSNILTGILYAPGDLSNQPIAVLDRWQKPGDVKQFARFTTNSYSDNNINYLYNSNAAYTDASFIRLQNVSLSYTIPIKNKKTSQALKLYIQGENLFTITNYNGIDPETQNFNTIPRARVFTGGISFTL